jgi:beta-glucanase (GH16 family)
MVMVMTSANDASAAQRKNALLVLIALLAACSGTTPDGGAPATGGAAGKMAQPVDGAAPMEAALGPGVRDIMTKDVSAAVRDASQDASDVAVRQRVDAARPATDAGRPGWTLVWSDEFDVDGAPDPASWGFERGFVRNEELQWYQAANATVQNGILTIEARREQVANPNYQAGSSDWKRNRQFADYTSTSMTTSGHHSFTYGRFEIRARIDTRTGSWPAFWMLGAGVGWPQSGEVDIMEYYRSMVLANVCKPSGSTCGWSSIRQSVASLGGDAFSSAFHVWAMQWDATQIDLFLDDMLVNRFLVADAVATGTTNPYVGHPMYLLINQAIGGTNGGDPTNTTFPIGYEVDYVRVYAPSQ